MNKYQYEMLTKEEIIEKSYEGSFIDHLGILSDMDGTKAKKYLESKGFLVTKNEDVGTNGWAYTSCGLKMSTNGFVCRINE